MTMKTPTRSADSAVRLATLPGRESLGGGRRRRFVLAGAAAVLVAGGAVTWGVTTGKGESSSPAPLALSFQSGAPNATHQG